MTCAKELLCRLEKSSAVLASEMQLTPRTFKRWWKKLNVPPTVPGHASHRWSDQDAALLLKRWEQYWKKRVAKNSRRPSASKN